VLAIEIFGRLAGFVLLEDRDDLRFTRSAFFTGGLLARSKPQDSTPISGALTGLHVIARREKTRKELCDTLVACPPHATVFSVKEVGLNVTPTIFTSRLNATSSSERR
jgi:hypothetical protein